MQNTKEQTAVMTKFPCWHGRHTMGFTIRVKGYRQNVDITTDGSIGREKIDQLAKQIVDALNQ